MKVLMIITLNLKTAGNQALYNSLMGLVEAGHEVVCLQIRGEHVQPELRDLHPSISVRHRSLLPWPLRRLVLAIYRGLRTVESRLLRRRQGHADGPESDTYIGYDPAAPESLFQALLDKFHWTLFQVLAVWNGWRIIRREGIDVVYGYETWGAPAASILGRIHRIPVVKRFQGTFLGPMMGSRLKLLAYFEGTLAMKGRADLVVMTNDGTRGEEVLRRMGVSNSRVLFIGNGVQKGDTPGSYRESVRRELEIAEDTRVLLTVSKLALWKRVDRAIRALPSVLREEPNTLLVVVGDGPEREHLVQLAHDLGVGGHVRFLGALPHSRVLQIYDAADIFISTYDLSNRGNPLLEALSRGSCIVTLDDGSVDDLIVHGENGVLIDPNRIGKELPAAIISLLRAPDLRAGMATKARRTADEKLMTWEQRNRIEVARIESLVESFRTAGGAEAESAAQGSVGGADE